jgi:hypothetical protein
MMFFPLDYVIDRTIEKSLSKEQWLLKELTGKRFNAKESEALWKRISDHKWYVSEQLGRDIGLKVAAIDFVENLYEPPRSKVERRPYFTFPFGSVRGAKLIA